MATVSFDSHYYFAGLSRRSLGLSVYVQRRFPGIIIFNYGHPLAWGKPDARGKFACGQLVEEESGLQISIRHYLSSSLTRIRLACELRVLTAWLGHSPIDGETCERGLFGQRTHDCK